MRTAAEIEASVLAAFQVATGTTLLAADPRRLLLQTIASELAQLHALVEVADRRNLPLHADGTHLDALGAFVGVARPAGAASVVTLEYSRPAAAVPVIIPAAHRVTTPDGAFTWETTEALTLGVGDFTGQVTARCTVLGVASNDVAIGAISVLVDPIATLSVQNVDATAGGRDEATDDEYRLLVVAAPDGFTTCGPRSAYEWHARLASPLVLDATALGPDDPEAAGLGIAAGEVWIFLLVDSADPLVIADVIALVDAALSADDVRPLTDDVLVDVATLVPYDIDLEYWIHQDDAGRIAEIQAAVAAAVVEFGAWQEAKIGRDVNPTRLVSLLAAAGAGLVTVTDPVYAAVDRSEVAALAAPAAVTYGGLFA